MNDEQSTDLTVKTQINIGNTGLQITNLSELGRFSEAVSRSPFAPRDFKDAGSIMVAIQMGMEVGLKPMQALQGIAVVNGRPTIWGDTAKALVMASGLCEDFQEFFEGDGTANKKDLKAVCVIKRKGIKSPIRAEFSLADAERAGLAGKQGPWTQYPRRMLQMRARSYAIRDAFPDVLKGLGTAEELGDYTPEDNVRPLAPESEKRLGGGGASDESSQMSRPIETIATVVAPMKAQALAPAHNADLADLI